MTAPLVKNLTLDAQPVTAISGDTLAVVDRAPFAGTVTAVTYIPVASKSGAAVANSRTLNLYNRGAAGTGTTLVATLPLLSGTDLVDNVPKSLTLSSAASLVVASGDVLEWESLHMSSGMTDPGGKVLVTVSRT